MIINVALLFWAILFDSGMIGLAYGIRKDQRMMFIGGIVVFVLGLTGGLTNLSFLL
jgi:hypothetical protein